MIQGMTGFGSAQVNSKVAKGVVEIKAVNHRYFDTVFYLPVGFASLESRIRSMLNKHVKRGRVTVSLKLNFKADGTVNLNKEVVSQYLKYSKQLKKDFKLVDNLTTADVIRLPGVVEVRENFVDAQTVWPDIEKSLNRSIKDLLVMRKREGRSLKKDVSEQIRQMNALLNKIKARTKSLISQKKKILTDEEFSSYQKSTDVNEEIKRLGHFLVESKALLQAKVPMGKKLDFIAQEMQRETNTIGSKLQDNIVTNSVISLKSKIEKIREQAQNIE